MTRTPLETGPFLEWLGDVLRRAEGGVAVDVIVDDTPSSRASVQITLRDVLGSLGGFEVRPCTYPPRI